MKMKDFVFFLLFIMMGFLLYHSYTLEKRISTVELFIEKSSVFSQDNILLA